MDETNNIIINKQVNKNNYKEPILSRKDKQNEKNNNTIHNGSNNYTNNIYKH